jgi:hypothetical protein
MFYYNDFSQYQSESILRNSSTAHSGPELMPDSIHADRLALEVVLDKICLDSYERPAAVGTGSERVMKVVL